MAVIEDAAQLVKANSIEGNKMNDIDVVYTLWENLHKTDSMDVGQVGFHRQKEVRKIRVSKRCNDIVNRLKKTKEEKVVNFQEQRDLRDRREREDKKRIFKSYTTLMKEDTMKSNKDGGEDSDDFM
ncbi:hypothetical protein TCAL_13471 [Tigriopus californicus]|uniref:Coiled-coil domain-containing protein 25 n=1 Tax=Tigriopus californicus TaxID=6832 RepID=A0A553N7L9_TIGCA|nr:hypothetical protein TCAL_13471 [Tigriopus californicus]